MDEPVRPGEILAHKYRVDRVLGVGGMGVVVAATHISLDQRVALKFMLTAAFQSPTALARFHREARIAVKLRSEHVARVTDTGTLDNGAPYIVMEYLEGADLGAQLAQHGPMPVGFAAECIVQACDAVGEAHSHGVVHRDLKPANLFLTQRPDGSPLVKVLDFGISKASVGPEEGMAMTKTGAVMGSPLYMSPEQLRSLKTADTRTDVWALGVVLYELLSGKTPFDAETFADLLLQVMTTQHVPLSKLNPQIPPEVSALVDACLAKDPAARVQSVAQLAEGLSPFCSATGVVIAQRVVALARKSGTTGDPRAVTGPMPAPGAAHASASTGVGWGRSGPVPTTKRPWGWIAGAAVVLVGAIIAGVAFTSRGTSAPLATTPPSAAAAPSPPAPVEPAPTVTTTLPAAPPPTAVAADITPPTPTAPTPASSAQPGSRTKSPSAPRAAAPPRPAHAATPPHAPPHPATPPAPGAGILDTSN
jgi:hypothetical protein